MTLFKVAFRNVFRNRRRSLMTMLTIAVGTLSILLIGAMLSFIMLDFQSSVIRRVGHLTIYKRGYFEFGAGNSSAYGIANYEKLLRLVRRDPELKTWAKVVTPVQALLGLAGNYEADRSKPFFGEGIIPADRVAMRQWDDFRLGTAGSDLPELPDDPEAGVVGYGLGRILGLCRALDIPKCASAAAAPGVGAAPADPAIQRLSAEAAADHAASAATTAFGAGATRGPRIDLLSATAGGAPNVVSMYVDHAEFQGNKNVDDNYAVMHLALAQNLVYGRGEHMVTGIVVQLLRSRDMAAARARLEKLFEDGRLDYEVRDFTELTPLYNQALAFFAFIFTFMSIILGVIVLFTVINTMSMAVMERIDEIGTLRALGLQRSEVRGQFLLEGCLLGGLGAAGGAVIAELVALTINASNLHWTPPTSAGLVPLKLFISGWLLAGTWLTLVVLASLASFFPAGRASRMNIVDALRHV